MNQDNNPPYRFENFCCHFLQNGRNTIKAANDVGRKANLINIINDNGKQIRRAGIKDLVLRRI
ncbi:MAG: hypothetical protein AAFQ80_12070 [Cyanobacteria bacterium J06621_8]